MCGFAAAFDHLCLLAVGMSAVNHMKTDAKAGASALLSNEGGVAAPGHNRNATSAPIDIDIGVQSGDGVTSDPVAESPLSDAGSSGPATPGKPEGDSDFVADKIAHLRSLAASPTGSTGSTGSTGGSATETVQEEVSD